MPEQFFTLHFQAMYHMNGISIFQFSRLKKHTSIEVRFFFHISHEIYFIISIQKL